MTHETAALALGSWSLIVRNALYLLALINPASKIAVLVSLSETHPARDLRRMALHSSWAAFVMVLGLAATGRFLLRDVFHVELYSLQAAGGLIVLYFGFQAVARGQFFEVHDRPNVMEMSLVPLASPLIAGPGTITAAMTLAAQHGLVPTTVSLVCALLVNLLLMLAAERLGHWLLRLNLMGPLIRITGLVVAAVAVQMILSGLSDWIRTIEPVS